jgi:hypothetical protein
MMEARIGCAALLVAMLGCGKLDDGPGDIPSSPPPSPAQDGGAMPDAKPAAPTRRAFILVMNTLVDDLGASAHFSIDPKEPPLFVASGCSLFESRVTSDVSQNAGNIVIDAAKRGSMTLAFDPRQKEYGVGSLSGAGEAGALIRIQAAGGLAVPAFEGNVRLATVGTRVLEPAEGATLPRAGGADRPDFVIRWEDSGNETLEASLSVQGSHIECTFPAAAGQGIVPGALVEKAIARMDSSKCTGACGARLWLSFGNWQRVTAGDYDVHISSSSSDIRELRLE